MLERILPDVVEVAESWGDSQDGVLAPEELELVRNARPKRVAEFRSGRLCARRALAQLGIAPAPLGVRGKRAPRWPTGVVGSITHCTGFVAAAVARSEDLFGIGIDAEPNERLPRGVLHRIASPAEEAWAVSAQGEVAGDRLLFCIKESIYKVWSPATDEWLGFEDAFVEVDLATRTFRAQLSPVRLDGKPPELAVLHGSFAVEQGIVAAATTVGHDGCTA